MHLFVVFVRLRLAILVEFRALFVDQLLIQVVKLEFFAVVAFCGHVFAAHGSAPCRDVW